MKKNLRSPVFWLSFSLSLGAILFAAAMLITDYRCRRTLTGDDSALFTVINNGREVSLAVNAFGMDKPKDITALHRIWAKFCDLICIPHS